MGKSKEDEEDEDEEAEEAEEGIDWVAPWCKDRLENKCGWGFGGRKGKARLVACV